MAEKLEAMAEFFARRAEGYDEHMMKDIEGLEVLYPYAVSLLPKSGALLDLGCGTGLELEAYFAAGGGGAVTGIDLSQAMLDRLSAKLSGRDITLICESFLDRDFGRGVYDAAITAEAMHHYSDPVKTKVYRNVFNALKPGGVLVVVDYFADNDGQEKAAFAELERLKAEAGLSGDDTVYHFDTPMTVGHENNILFAAGFGRIEIRKSRGSTYVIRAVK